MIADANAAMRVMREESFGPVLGVQRVRDDADAIAQLDNTEYGLGAAVFTNDQARAQRILEQLDVGNAYWNTSDRSSVTLPWAGRRNSGLARPLFSRFAVVGPRTIELTSTIDVHQFEIVTGYRGDGTRAQVEPAVKPRTAAAASLVASTGDSEPAPNPFVVGPGCPCCGSVSSPAITGSDAPT